jgi:alkylhydroperoxidase family enzyme
MPHIPVLPPAQASKESNETADCELLTRHGLNHSEIVELVAMSGLAVYANIMADATAMEPDKMFASL